jgi:ADP-heptose:LPS heptosyltransferase
MVNKFQKMNFNVVLLGYNIDELRVGCIDLRGKLALPQTAYAISKLDALITNNQDIAQIAAAVDCPQVALLKTPNAVKIRPWSKKAHVMLINDDEHELDDNISMNPYNYFNKIFEIDLIIKNIYRLLNKFDRLNHQDITINS